MSVVPTLEFNQDPVKILTSKDFTTEFVTQICLKYDDCILVLFYDQSDLSKQYATTWSKAAEKIIGPIFAACDLHKEAEIKNAFMKVKMDPNHGLFKYAHGTTPFVMTYRKSWPKAYYNGVFDVDTIEKYAITLAGQADYTEDTFNPDPSSRVLSSSSSSSTSSSEFPPSVIPSQQPNEFTPLRGTR